jgi:hypothetical protein
VQPDARETAASGNSALYSLASILIFAHLFCVFVALSANLSPSLLQGRLLNVFRPYLQLLNFDPDFTPFHLTHATEDDVDQRWEVLPADKAPTQAEDWLVLPGGGFRGSERHKRLQRLAKVGSAYAAAENDAATAELATSISRFFLSTYDVPAQQVRCRRHLLQDWEVFDRREAPPSPFDESYFRTSYAARILIGDDGRISVVKISERRETALPDTREETANP